MKLRPISFDKKIFPQNREQNLFGYYMNPVYTCTYSYYRNSISQLYQVMCHIKLDSNCLIITITGCVMDAGETHNDSESSIFPNSTACMHRQFTVNFKVKLRCIPLAIPLVTVCSFIRLLK